jgi:3-oxoacyl-[acyl-carrier-protein] synthase II
MEQYVVTGIGTFNGLGPTSEESWQNLLAGKTAVRELNWPKDDPQKFPATYSGIKIKLAATSPIPENYPDYFSPAWTHWDPNTKACMLTVDEAIKDAELKSKNTGVIVSTFGSGTTVRLDFFSALTNGKSKVSPRKTLNMGLDYPATQVASIYKVTGPNMSLDSACTTGISSIDCAINILKANPNLDAMIVSAADHTADPIYVFWFQSLGALSLSDDINLASCPWDTKRNGFVMGEGAATLIIEPLSKAQARGAKIYGIVKSCNFVTLFESDTSPDPDGVGARNCVQGALDLAGISAEQVDYVNAHATSTPIGDQIEFDAMLALTPNRVMVSNKGQIGHGMATCGIIETIYTLLTFRDQRTPGNANLTDPLGTGMILPTVATDINATYAVKNSFGFGGRNASMVLARYEG